MSSWGGLCKEKKTKAAGKKAFALLKAFGKNHKKPDAGKLESDISKAQSKFTKGFIKAEGKGQCLTSGDADPIEAQVDAFVLDVIGEVSPFIGDQRIIYSDGLHSENTEMIKLGSRVLLAFRGGKEGRTGSVQAGIFIYESTDDGRSFTRISQSESSDQGSTKATPSSHREDDTDHAKERISGAGPRRHPHSCPSSFSYP